MNKGFSLVEVLVTCLILGIVSLGAGTLFVQMSRMQNKTNVKESSLLIRSNMFSLFRNERAVREMLTRNPSMACLLATPSSCTSGSSGVVDVYQPDGSLFFRTSAANQGFTKEGQSCDTYGTAPVCSMRYQISWRALCGADCTNPQILVTGVFQGQQTDFPINLSNYNFEVVIPRFTDALWIRCAEKGMFFLPSGIGGFTADADGCIDPNAFKGADGPPGPPGPQGTPAVCPVCP